MSGTPAWEPDVVVVGLGAAGTATVDGIDTDTAATLRTVDDPTEVPASVQAAVGEAGFVFLTGDVDETGVLESARRLARGTDACSVFVVEGLSSVPTALVAALNLVVPIDREEASPLIVRSLLIDLFEAMMTPTLRALGHGGIRTVIGDGRVGRVAIRPLEDDTPMWLSPRLDDRDPAAALVFVCAGRELPSRKVEHAAKRADEDGLGALLWDQRLDDRYAGAAHVKRLHTTDDAASSTRD